MENLIGIWNFKNSILMDANKKVLPNDPINSATGLIIYTNTKHMSVQLQIPKQVLENASIDMQMDYVAYCGTYDFDAPTSVLY